MGKPKKATIFKCKHCPREFKKQGNFANHMKCHKVPRAFKCVQCELLFISALDLNYHITHEHLKPEVLDCSECGDTFINEASFKSHVCKQIILTDFTCDECSRSFKYLRNLRNHEKVHFRQRKQELHSCHACPKMFATDAALKKHQLIHSGIDLNFSSSLQKSGILKRDSKIVKQSARKSTRATRIYWCHLCNCGFTEIEKFKKHIINMHQRAKNNESDADFDKTNKKSPLTSNKSVEKCNSPTKFKTIKQEKCLKNSKQQNVKFTAERQQTKENIKTEADTEYSQEQPIVFDGNQFTVGLAQSHHLGGMYNNSVQPVQQPSNSFINIGNMPNVQFNPAPPNQHAQQNVLESVPKFDFFSENYMRWLKKFINKCEFQKHPFPQVLVKKIGKVNNDLFNALIEIESLEDRKKDHIYLTNLYKSLANIMYNHVKYHLTGSK